ncbi:hypothetical protein KA012_04900 [Candidatus Woesebacteria bacterium]|nr:hypothetical protein [Candidatus Woesebacteria bacterium]MBP9717290.1 hypothetical protein [Candidatus Paceibacterota bacterium]
MKDSASVTPLTREKQLEIFRDITLRTRARKEAELPPYIKSIRFDGSRDAFLFLDFFYGLERDEQDIIRERLLREHDDYLCDAIWNKLGDQVMLVLQSSPRHDPNRRRRARGDLPKIVSEMIAALQ